MCYIPYIPYIRYMNCKHCQSKKMVKSGWDYRASGKVQRWICKECGKMTILIV